MPRLTARERRESYLREYSYQKRTGKPFFPYALYHDVLVNFFFILLIVALAVLWYVTSGTGPDANHGGSSGWLGPRYEDRADPAVETYDPRPEWYFFFLFELLRIFTNPNLILLATIIIPTIWMGLLIGIPFLDRTRERRLSRRPIAVGFAGAMAVLLLVLTYKGSVAPGASAATGALGQKLANEQCTTCHTLKETGWNSSGPGPNLNSVHPNYQLALDRVTNGGPGGMPSFKGQFDQKKLQCIATYVASITNGGTESTAAGGAPSSPTQACTGVPLP
jgi:menaquinol-cytochrome c reductase cytochrome b/c subunit